MIIYNSYIIVKTIDKKKEKKTQNNDNNEDKKMILFKIKIREKNRSKNKRMVCFLSIVIQNIA